ncbi:3-(3-hydroxy-phenyl)propionate hydroxylase [Actinokineospora alba]|uniref:3-(3-hydroxy-phenyl)propionate hydroxylase n=1 Tax=Actinokineospora alba TaxID=504798 RepID=A0A1H0WJT4_9PSEU|nr:FAD-dependent monooxygenase [Actinokineospora alba]TDP65427.1 3-(3-hydroxy-phenyl)propionate hydroxylase [Actinokineospora alba]SDH61971.1 3-(3-hydroxy-phenyl)propionate hydroxylase [Actinokineospora alba]SDP90990.1 3-(3-hydroxy-phenyl)propionate hydroxylase [Actinokineospora alba]
MSDPVLIVGAGPVGLTSAILLARQGIPSIVLESRPTRTLIGSRAICVQRDILDILERAGVGRKVVDAGVTWYSGRMFYREHEVVVMTFPETPPGLFPPFVNTPQNIVEQLLEDQAEQEPLIDVRYGNTVAALTQDDDGVSLSVDTATGRHEVRGTHCIAADGSRSTLRELLGLPFEGRSFNDRFLITDIRAKLDFPVPERRFYFDPEWNPGRQVLLHPQPDSVWRIDWQVPEDFDLETERENGGLHARVRQIIGENTAYDLLWASVYRFHQRRVPRMRVDRVFMAGDAAHVMSPFGARGMNSGLADAENAAWKIAAVRSGWAGPALPATYDTERGAAADENLAVTATTMRFLVPADDTERARRRDVLERSIHDPAARAEINSGKLSEPFWYLDSPLTTPGADTTAFPTEPSTPRPPIPGVLCPDFQLGETRLRATFGPTFTVLLGPKAATPTIPDSVPGTKVVRLSPEAAVALDLAPAGLALVRPDGYLAATLTETTAAALPNALRRACGWADQEAARP